MKTSVPANAESFSTMVWPTAPCRPATLRPGWLTAMVVEAQEQLHRGTLPVETLPRRRPRMITSSTQPQAQPALTCTPLPPPTLQHIVREDLTDIQRLLVLYHHAVQQRLIGSSEAERLTFVALAQHVLNCRPKSEGGLFRHLLKQKRYHCVTQADEDAALPRLKQHLYGRG